MPEDFVRLIDVGARGLQGHPEGIARWESGRWLVVHDAPAPWRLERKTRTILADLWELGGWQPTA